MLGSPLDCCKANTPSIRAPIGRTLVSLPTPPFAESVNSVVGMEAKLPSPSSSNSACTMLCTTPLCTWKVATLSRCREAMCGTRALEKSRWRVGSSEVARSSRCCLEQCSITRHTQTLCCQVRHVLNQRQSLFTLCFTASPLGSWLREPEPIEGRELERLPLSMELRPPVDT